MSILALKNTKQWVSGQIAFQKLMWQGISLTFVLHLKELYHPIISLQCDNKGRVHYIRNARVLLHLAGDKIDESIKNYTSATVFWS